MGIAVERGDEAETLARAEVSQHVLAACERRSASAHHPPGDEVHRLAGITFQQNHLAGRERALVHMGRDFPQGVVAEPGKERQLGESLGCDGHQLIQRPNRVRRDGTLQYSVASSRTPDCSPD